MNIKIICFQKDNIEFENRGYCFECIDSSQNKDNIYKKCYYKVRNNKVEVLCLNNENYIENLKYNSDIVLTLLRNINSMNIKVIKKIHKSTNSINIIGAKDKLVQMNDVNNVIVFDKLKDSKKINLDVLVWLCEKNEVLQAMKFNKFSTNIMVEKKDSIGKIAMEVLNKFSYLKDSKELNLYLFSKEELNLQELAYLEDPIKEYISEDSALNINNLYDESIDDDCYFLVAGSK